MHHINCPTPKENAGLSLAVILYLFVCVHETRFLLYPQETVKRGSGTPKTGYLCLVEHPAGGLAL